MPEVTIDLARTAWPWAEASIEEVACAYSLSQMGESPSHLRHFFCELYRVCQPNAKVAITEYYPRHDRFVLNPLCVHRMSPNFCRLLSVQYCLNAIAQGESDNCLALEWGVNFEVTRFKHIVDASLQPLIESGQMSETELRRRIMCDNNVCQEFEVDLVAVKNQP